MSSSTQGRRALSVGKAYQFYPSPFFDIASTYIPRSIKDTFEWCAYYQQTNPLISAITGKMAAYPITDIKVREENPGIVEMIEGLFERVNLRERLIECNLDRYTFGNFFVSVSFPIEKYLTCPSCKKIVALSKTKYTWKNYGFHYKCKKCEQSVIGKVRDRPVRSLRRVGIIRWNPRSIIVKPVGISDYEYSVKISRTLKNQILIGKPEVVERIPQAFIDAAKKGRTVRISSDRIFHGRRPSISKEGEDGCWGAPLILPVLRDVFFLQVLRKSQEAVAMEHIVPMRVLFPNIRSEADNPYANISIKKWQKEVTSQVEMWKRDVNHMPVMPVPIGYQQIGGMGKNLLLHQEVRIYSEQIIAGMGVPVGFFYGEAQYSGASVNMKALENEFKSNREDMRRLVRFILKQVCTFHRIPVPRAEFKPFKMADDLMSASFKLQMIGAGLISEKDFVEERDYNYDAQQSQRSDEIMIKGRQATQQSKGQASAQGEAMLIQARYQAKAQAAAQAAAPAGAPGMEGQPPGAEGQPPPPGAEGPPPSPGAEGQPPPPGVEGQPPAAAAMQGAGMAGSEQQGTYVDMFAQAQSMVNELKQMPPATQHQYLTAMENQQPHMAALVRSGLRSNMPSSNNQNHRMPSYMSGTTSQ